MSDYVSAYVQLVSVAAAQGNGDAITNKASISVPKRGRIMSVTVVDLGKQSVNMDVELFSIDFTATTINAVYDPADAELSQQWHGSILVDTWKAYNDSSIGIVDNVGLPYYAPSGLLYTQLVTRGTPTPAGTADYSISLGIEY